MKPICCYGCCMLLLVVLMVGSLSGSRILCATEFPHLFDLIKFDNTNTIIVEANIYLLEPRPSSPPEIKVILPDTEVVLQRQKIEVRSENNYTWFGTVNHHHSSMVVLTVIDHIISGFINIGELQYQITYQDSQYSITKTMSKFFLPLINDNEILLPLEYQSMLTRSDVKEDGSVIDVMVYYTTEFQAKYGRDPKREIQKYIDISNQVFENSQIQTRFNLVGYECMTEDDVQEHKDIKHALNYLTSLLNNGNKKRYSADLVTLLRVHKGSAKCGRAWPMTPPMVDSSFKYYSYSVVEEGTSCSQYTFTHELAHNLGCSDDIDHAENAGAYPYSYGYQIPGIFATIMSYYQPSIPYFSNPNITYNGYPIGIPNVADNARTINQTRTIVANFMPRDISPPPQIEIITSTNRINVPEGSEAFLEVRLGAQPSQIIHLSIWRSTGDSDISVTNPLLIFNTSTWNIPQTVKLTAALDTDTINGEATIKLNGTGLVPKEITAVEIDIGIPPEIIVSSNVVVVPEGGTASITVKLSSQPSSTTVISVNKYTGDPDLSVQSGATLTFTQNNWSMPQPVVFSAAEDQDTLDGTAIFQISAPGLIQKQIELKEKDNDQALSFITIDTINVPECETASFDVKLSLQPQQTISASVTRIAGDPDITVQSGASLTFSPTDWNNPKTVVLAAACDSDTYAGNANIQISAEGVTTKQITAIEKECPIPEILLDKSTVYVTEGGTGTFQVKLSLRPCSDITVTVVRESGDTDISVQSGATLSFTRTNWNDYQTVTLSASQDSDNLQGSAIIRLSGSGLISKQITAIEVEPILPLEFVTDKTTVYVPEGGTATFGVKLSKQPSGTISVSVSIVSGDPDISITSANILNFSSLYWNEYQYVTLMAANDSDTTEGAATIRLSASGISSKDITAVEKEKPMLIVQPLSLAIKEGESSGFDVRLSAAPTESVLVRMTITGDPDITILGGTTLTFTPTNWDIVQTVGVSVSNDTDAVNGEATIQLSATNYSPVTVTIKEIDKDTPALLKISDIKVMKGSPVSVPLFLENYQNIEIEGIDIVISFSENVLDATGTTMSGSILENMNYFVINNTNVDGKVTIRLYAATETLFKSSGIITTVLFKAVGNEGDRTDLQILADLNEKPLNTQKGSVEILSNAYTLAGNVKYYQNNIPVRNVKMDLTGSDQSNVITNENGNYHFPALMSGNYTLTPSKTDDLSGISATDVSRIARTSIEDLNCYQRIAADVNQNGVIGGAQDASLLARYSAGLRSCLNDKCIDWVFTATPIINCSQNSIPLTPTRQYLPLSANLTNENFIAIRLGDVTGNWQPDSQIFRSVPKEIGEQKQIYIESQQQEIKIPIYLAEETEIEGIDIVVTYDSKMLKATDATLTGGILEGKPYALQSNLISEGKISLTIYALATPIRSKGILAYITLTSCSSQKRSISPTSSLVSFKRFDVNEAPYLGMFFIDQQSVSQLVVVRYSLEQIIQILRVLTGLSISEVIPLDINQDNRADFEDVIMIFQIIAGIR